MSGLRAKVKDDTMFGLAVCKSSGERRVSAGAGVDAERLRQLMTEAIEEAARSEAEDDGIHPLVGAILADPSGEVIAKAHRGERGGGAHAEYCLLCKAEETVLNVEGTTLFVTLEPCMSRGPEKIPCAQRIVDSGISKVYIGTLDPDPAICGRGQLYLQDHVEVGLFPHDLFGRLKEMNSEFFRKHAASHIPSTSLYAVRQIPELMIEYLQRKGVGISKLPYTWDVTLDDASKFLAPVAGPQTSDELSNLLRKARNVAFDQKYGDYSYAKDVRGLSDVWVSEFFELLALLGIGDLASLSVLAVGIGNGLEGESLFGSCSGLTILDIAPDSLQSASARLPDAVAIQGEAENLEAVGTGSQDVYVSLRTYQSTYFDIPKATREACRVVRRGGAVLISVANGFRGDDDSILRGHVIPGTVLIDRSRPFAVAEEIRRQLTLLEFGDIGVRSGFSEVFVYGVRCW